MSSVQNKNKAFTTAVVAISGIILLCISIWIDTSTTFNKIISYFLLFYGVAQLAIAGLSIRERIKYGVWL